MPRPRLSIDAVIPNPFNPAATVYYSIPQPGPVNARIYNTRGQPVKILVSGRQDAGRQRITWRGDDANGVRVASGVYFIRIESSGLAAGRKVVLLK